MIPRFFAAILITILMVSLNGPAMATQTPAKPWSDTTEFSAVGTGGNSNVTTLSLKNSFQYDWPTVGLEIHLVALNANSNGVITAEQYFINEKVSRKFDNGGYVFERIGWDANVMAGVVSRFHIFGGYGWPVIKRPDDSLFAEIGLGYITEQLTTGSVNFPSGRLFGKYSRPLSATANFSQDAEFVQNFSDTTDYRVHFVTAVSAALIDNLAMKGSFSWKRVNKPAAGFGKTDTQTTLALVLNY